MKKTETGKKFFFQTKGIKKSRGYYLLSLLLLGFLVFLLASGEVVADDNRFMHIRQVIIDAEVQRDGTIQVTEERTHFFGGGQFFGSYQKFDYGKGFRYDNFQVR